jgi:heme-degrading monooxygenase HmoA
MGNGYTYVWEFQVPPHSQSEFERSYGANGAWARLFRRSPDYLETLLLKDRSTTGRYVTVDRWRSEESYLEFRTSFAQQYAELDRECERLTTGETMLGAFSE